MSFFKNLFPTLAEVQEVTKEKESLETKLKNRDIRIEELYQRIDDFQKSHKREVENLEFNHGIAIRNLEQKVTDTEAQSAREVSLADTNADLRVLEVEAKAEIELEKAEASVRAKVQKEVDELKATVSEALVNEASALATAEAQESTILSLQGQIEDYDAMIQFLATKIPDVDLSQFNVNVDVQPANVTVQGGQQVKKN